MSGMSSFTDSASSAGLLTAALDALVLETAAAPSGARMLVVRCERCRNHLLYLMDTAPYAGQAAGQIRARLHALGQVHERHSGPDGPDRAAPKIRGLA
jgi:hypothetical protein